ncbi:MAG TPA: phage major capsid protein [Microthrixaceae bacterium]|nr:phage major capsid protein [Microthrixaceae bacterium]HMT24807.1 phage major capsid protein [Microthrixaceae bacterium]HMT59825.1 phage major capsid protein [Microthrixaceae bacterium]
MSLLLARRAFDEKLRAETEIRSIFDAADGRDLTGEELASVDRLDGEVRSLGDRVSELMEQEQRSRDAADALARLAPVDESDGGADVDDVGAQLRSFLRGEQRSVVVAPERRDLVKGTATAGGNTVPTTFYGRLVEHMVEVSGVLAAGPTLLETASGESIEVPTTTAFSTAALTAEAVAIAESDPAFAKRTLGAYKYGATIQVSRELIDDTAVDLLGFIAAQAGRAVGNALGAALVTGSGSSQPAGVATQATAGKTGAATTPTTDDLIDLMYSVISPYRASSSCCWMFRDATAAHLRKLKDDNGQYLWQPSLVLGQPDMLLGKPVATDPNVAAADNSAKSVLFGDFAAYWVRLAGGVRFERSDDFAFSSDLVTFKVVARADGMTVDQTGAIKAFVGVSA